MKTRLLLGPILIAIVIGLFWLDHRLDAPYAFAGLCSLGMIACVSECAAMFKRREIAADKVALDLTGLALLAYLLVTPDLGIAGSLIAISIASAFLVVVTGLSNVWNRQIENFLPEYSGTLTLYLYVVMPIAAMLAIRSVPDHGEWLIYWVIAVCKLCDSGAYFTGKFLGKRKLIPHVSPNKTIEGLLGGLVTAGLVGLVCWLSMPTLDGLMGLVPFIALSVGLGFVSAHGDLVASAIKRGAGVKDSGRFLPEFGGVLDLVDNFMIAAPALLIVLFFVVGA